MNGQSVCEQSLQDVDGDVLCYCDFLCHSSLELGSGPGSCPSPLGPCTASGLADGRGGLAEGIRI